MSIKKERLWSPKGKGYTKNSIINCFLINGKKKEGEREGHAWNIRVVSGSPILLWIWMFCSVLWALNFTTLLARGLRNVCFGTNHLCFSVLTVTRIMDHYYMRDFCEWCCEREVRCCSFKGVLCVTETLYLRATIQSWEDEDWKREEAKANCVFCLQNLWQRRENEQGTTNKLNFNLRNCITNC